MDEQLKRRLVGAAIIVLLAIVVIPLFFEDKSREAPTALPEPVVEHALTLPKNDAEPGYAPDGNANSGTGVQAIPSAAPKKRKYEVVPLDDAPPKPVKVEPAPAATVQAAPAAPSEMPMEDEDPGMEPPAFKPTPADGQGKATKPASKLPAARVTATATGTPKPASTKPKPKPKPSGTVVSRDPPGPPPARTAAPASVKPAKATAAARAVEPAARKPAAIAAKETAKPVNAAPAQASAPKAAAGSGKSWTVQAGTFADESNARALTEKLQKRNLPARIHVSEGASGKVYRVTVGPNLERGRAEKIQKQLSSQDDVKGVILQTR